MFVIFCEKISVSNTLTPHPTRAPRCTPFTFCSPEALLGGYYGVTFVKVFFYCPHPKTTQNPHNPLKSLEYSIPMVPGAAY